MLAEYARNSLTLRGAMSIDHPVVEPGPAEDRDAVRSLDIADHRLVPNLAHGVVGPEGQCHLIAEVGAEGDRGAWLDVVLHPARHGVDGVIPGRGRQAELDREREQGRGADQADGQQPGEGRVCQRCGRLGIDARIGDASSAAGPNAERDRPRHEQPNDQPGEPPDFG